MTPQYPATAWEARDPRAVLHGFTSAAILAEQGFVVPAQGAGGAVVFHYRAAPDRSSLVEDSLRRVRQPVTPITGGSDHD